VDDDVDELVLVEDDVDVELDVDELDGRGSGGARRRSPSSRLTKS
jgi:hypothetical protein